MVEGRHGKNMQAVEGGSQKPKKIGIVLFPGYEALDVFGPVEMWGHLPDHEVQTVSEHGGMVPSAQGIATLAACSFATAPQFDVIMVPGGMAVRAEVENASMLEFLRKQDHGTSWTTSVCTGSAILARAGLLDGRRATSNKSALPWVAAQSRNVDWRARARWVVDGKYMTSSGVSAGTDMALALVDKLYGRVTVQQIADYAEYVWNPDPDEDAFAVPDVLRITETG